MKTIKTFLVIIFFLMTGSLSAQTGMDSTIKCKICKPWAIALEENNKKVDPENTNMANRITFYEDQTVYFTEGSQIREGRWIFDKDKKLIIIMDENFKNRVMALRIIKILPRQVTVELPNEEGKYQTVFLRLIED